MPEVMARGPNFVYGEEFVREMHGSAAWDEMLAELPPAAAETWRGILLVTGSYPFSHFKDMLAALSRVVGKVPANDTARGDLLPRAHALSRRPALRSSAPLDLSPLLLNCVGFVPLEPGDLEPSTDDTD